jgi:hypothetical protein
MCKHSEQFFCFFVVCLSGFRFEITQMDLFTAMSDPGMPLPSILIPIYTLES